MLTRTIPKSGEKLPVIGLGTWQTFDVGPSPGERKDQKSVLKRFLAAGARVIDSSPMYGRAETVVGDLVRELGEERKWKVEEKEGGKPQDEELLEVTSHLKEEELEWVLHRATSDKGETVETLVSEERAWMAAGGEYYVGQWDEEVKQLEVGRDDEEDEMGTGLVFTLTGELVYESQLED